MALTEGFSEKLSLSLGQSFWTTKTIAETPVQIGGLLQDFAIEIRGCQLKHLHTTQDILGLFIYTRPIYLFCPKNYLLNNI